MSQLAVKYMTSYTQHLLNVIFNDSLNCLCLFGVTCTTLKSDKTSFLGTICWARAYFLLAHPVRHAPCAANESETQTVQLTTVKLATYLSTNCTTVYPSIRLTVHIISDWWADIEISSKNGEKSSLTTRKTFSRTFSWVTDHGNLG